MEIFLNGKFYVYFCHNFQKFLMKQRHFQKSKSQDNLWPTDFYFKKCYRKFFRLEGEITIQIYKKERSTLKMANMWVNKNTTVLFLNFSKKSIAGLPWWCSG